ncbi:MAG TPA: winged helix-turn-helix domain-containing protein [Candidatus Acidoferrum sp.]
MRIKIQDQPFLILVKLVERPGQLVTREELRSALWGKDTFVDFDTGLNTAVKRLREALGDSVEAPRFIETLPKLGYRFVAAVQVAPQRLAVSEDSTQDKTPKARSAADWRRGALVAGLLLSGAAILVLYLRWHGAAHPPALEVVPLTGMAETEDYPAFSPDGNHVAFTVSEPADRAGVYIMLVGGEKPLRLTTSLRDCCPVWSPDGGTVAFVRLEQIGYTIYAVPALGGTPKVLYSNRTGFPGHVGMLPAFSWSPDGAHLAVNAISKKLPQPVITLISLADASALPITSPPRDSSDWSPAFSPDGKSVAFFRSSGPGLVEDVYTVPVTGGEAKRLTFDNRQGGSRFAWTPDGREVIFVSGRAGLWTLWRVPTSGGSPQRLEGVGSSAWSPAAALTGHRFAYTSGSMRVSFWSLPLVDAKHLAGPPKLLLSSKGGLGLPYFSPDGKKVAFESSQSGYDEIWTANSDGSDPTQFTFLKGETGTPHWSFDGRSIAFDYRPAGRSEIYLADVSGGPPQLFQTNPGANNIVPSWSRDGHWLYFASSRAYEAVQIWKAHYPQGGAIQLTHLGGTFPVESADGYLYYSKSFRSDEIWKIPVNGGPETLVLKTADLNCFCNWALAPAGIYFIAQKSGEPRTLFFYDFANKTTIELLHFEKYAINPALAPDGRSLIFNQTDQREQSIMLINHFQ